MYAVQTDGSIIPEQRACVGVGVCPTYTEWRWVIPSTYCPRHAGNVRVALPVIMN